MHATTLYVILNYRAPEDTARLANRLLEEGLVASQLLVIDNHSQDGSCQRLQQSVPSVEILETEENLGFAGGMNQGLERAQERGLTRAVLLNQDATLNLATLEKMHAAMDELPDAGIVGALVKDQPDGVVLHSAQRYSSWRGVISTVPWASDTKEPVRCDWVSGCALLVSMEAVQAAGLLDTDFFMYMEEIELSQRMEQVGWFTYLAPEAEVIHGIQNTASPFGRYMQWRNRWVYSRKAIPSGLRRLVYHANTLLSALRDLLGRGLKGRFQDLWPAFLGTCHGMRGDTGAPPWLSKT